MHEIIIYYIKNIYIFSLIFNKTLTKFIALFSKKILNIINLNLVF